MLLFVGKLNIMSVTTCLNPGGIDPLIHIRSAVIMTNHFDISWSKVFTDSTSAVRPVQLQVVQSQSLSVCLFKPVLHCIEKHISC